MRNFIRVMKALSDPSRAKIIKMLEQKELCVCEITAVLGLAQSTVSKHLKILEEADLVTYRKKGSWINYRIAADTDSDYSRTMLGNLEEWLNDDTDVQTMLARVKEVDRVRICAA
ncbi:ArsR/SmtB family transcription factor [Thermodesulfobacteriota bacterium]